MKQVYLICGWVVAACAILALILLVVAERHSGGDFIVYTICQTAYLGITATLALLYFADWIKNKNLFFIMAWVVAGLAILAFIMALIMPGGGAYLAGNIFFTIFTGLASTLALLRFSGKKG